VYQKASAPGEPIALNLQISEPQNLSVLPYHVPMKTCTKPKPGPYKREYEFELNPAGVFESYELTTLGWMIAFALSKSAEEAKIPG